MTGITDIFSELVLPLEVTPYEWQLVKLFGMGSSVIFFFS